MPLSTSTLETASLAYSAAVREDIDHGRDAKDWATWFEANKAFVDLLLTLATNAIDVGEADLALTMLMAAECATYNALKAFKDLSSSGEWLMREYRYVFGCTVDFMRTNQSESGRLLAKLIDEDGYRLAAFSKHDLAQHLERVESFLRLHSAALRRGAIDV